METADEREGYGRIYGQMKAAVEKWLKTHAPEEISIGNPLAEERTRGKSPKDLLEMLTMRLGAVADRWGLNPETRAFLHDLDAATDGKATYVMTVSFLSDIFSPGVKLMPEGDWACVKCKSIQGGFELEAQKRPPQAGDLCMCSKCGTVQRVADTGRAFTSVTMEEIAAFAPHLREQVLTARVEFELSRRPAKEESHGGQKA